ncbi:MAG: protein arginine kinase [Clostridiaceae bacterium]
MNQNENKASLNNDVAISSRIRLARNLEAYPFSSRLTREQGAEILEKVGNAVFNDTNVDSKDMSFVQIHELNAVDRQALVEKHLISPEFAEGERQRAAIISKDERISIMVNEEDHLRLQCIFPGMQIAEAWKLCSKLDTQLEEKLEFAFDKVYGYLTCCPTNTGTGIRASVMLHLPILSMTGYIKGILETCGKLGVAVRGIYGENSEASGNMFQISNQVTLGQTEEEIVAGIGNITSQIAEQERILRNELYNQNPVRFEDRIFRSLGLLLNARIISTEESLKLFSDVRLGIVMGLMKGMEPDELNLMMQMIQPACLQKLTGGQLSPGLAVGRASSSPMHPDERDQMRAELIRTKLKAIII